MSDRDETFMRDTDAFSWYLEKDPGLRSTIVAVTWLDSTPDFDLLAARLERATRLVPRFRQRPVQAAGRLAAPRWVETDFDLSWHLRHVGSPMPHTPSTVIDFARVEAMSGFDLSRPLWQFTLMDQLTGGRAALVMKVHHSLTDGIGGMQLALFLFDTKSTLDPGEEVAVPGNGEREPGALALVFESLAHDWHRLFETARHGLAAAVPGAISAARDPLGTASDAFATARSIGRFVQPVSDTLSQVMTGRSLGRQLDMLTVDLHDLKKAAASVEGTVNDAFMSSVTGGLRRYHERHGAPVGTLRVTLPISTRKEGDPAAGNRITLVRFELPVGLADPAERMRLTGRRCRLARDEPALPMTNAIAGTLNMLPSSAVGSMLKHIDFLASNVPGIGVPIYLVGAPVTGYFAFGPTTGSSVNVTLVSYCGTCCVGVTIDTAAVQDHDVLMECLREGFEEVLELGGDHHTVEMPLKRSRRSRPVLQHTRPVRRSSRPDGLDKTAKVRAAATA